jgi:hypothetical protein
MLKHSFEPVFNQFEFEDIYKYLSKFKPDGFGKKGNSSMKAEVF